LADFRGDEPKRPGDYGIETVNGMAWLARAVEDETIKRRGEEVIVYIQRLMPVDALRIRGRHNATPWPPWAWRWRPDAAWAMLHGLRDYRGEHAGGVWLCQDVSISTTARAHNVGATVAAWLAEFGTDRKLVVILVARARAGL
jgi:UDP-N-acetylmuramoylalanine--D-glutamate ligase